MNNVGSIGSILLEEMSYRRQEWFFNAPLKEQISVVHPEGFVISGKRYYVSLLRKELYGLRKASQERHKYLDTFLKDFGC